MAELPPPRVRREGEKVVVDLLTRGEVIMWLLLTLTFGCVFFVPFLFGSGKTVVPGWVLVAFLLLAAIPSFYGLNLWRRRRTYLLLAPEDVSLIQRGVTLWSVPWRKVWQVFIPQVNFSSTTFRFLAVDGETLGEVKLESGQVELRNLMRHFPEHVEVVCETGRKHLGPFRRYVIWGLIGMAVGFGLLALFMQTLNTMPGSTGVWVILGGCAFLGIGISNLLTLVSYRHRASVPEQMVIERPAIDPLEDAVTLRSFLRNPVDAGRFVFAYPAKLHDFSLRASIRLATWVLGLMLVIVTTVVSVSVNFAREPRGSAFWIIMAFVFSGLQVAATWYCVSWHRRMARLLLQIRDRLVVDDGLWFVEFWESREVVSLGRLRDHPSQRDSTGLLASSLVVTSSGDQFLFDPSMMVLEIS